MLTYADVCWYMLTYADVCSYVQAELSLLCDELGAIDAKVRLIYYSLRALEYPACSYYNI
jgi:hypothetical protein